MRREKDAKRKAAPTSIALAGDSTPFASRRSALALSFERKAPMQLNYRQRSPAKPFPTPDIPSLSMKSALTALLLIILHCLPDGASAALFDKEIVFTEAEIQTAIDRNAPRQRRVGTLLAVTLREAPKIRLGIPEGRVGIAARMEIALPGNPPIPVEVTGNAGVRYDDQAKAFFLDSPVADSVESVALPREFQAQVRHAVTQVMAVYFRDKPVYVLREDGSAEERAARWLLRRIRIETGKVVATLSPF